MAKGFKKNGKFHPTEKKNGVSSKDVKPNPNDKKPDKINPKDADDLKKKKVSIDDIIDKETEERVENLSEDEYDDFLDELDINSLIDEYSFSRVLKETDEIAYRTGLNDYVDSVIRDQEGEIEKEAEEKADEEIENNPKSFGLTEKDIEDSEDKYLEALEKRKDELVDEITEQRMDELMDDTEQYDQALDESPNPDIVGSYARTLKEIDPTAYRVGFSDWKDGERDRLEDEVRDEIDEDESLKKGEFVEQ